jgi:S-adenosylmethionine decarboxylase proenzyme
MFNVSIDKMSSINSNEKKDFWDIFIKKCFNDANITLLETSWNDFDNKGAFTVLYLLAESHLSIHTWPEHNYISLDVFTCGNSNTQLVVDRIIDYFKPLNKKIIHLKRGEIKTLIENDETNTS